MELPKAGSNAGRSGQAPETEAASREGGEGSIGSAIEVWLSRLEVARRMLRYYPPGHPATRQPLALVAEAAESLPEEVILLQVTSQGLVLDEAPLGEPASPIRTLAAELFALGIVAVVLRPPLDQQGLEAIVSVLAGLKESFTDEERDRSLDEASRIVGFDLVPLDVGWFVFSSTLGEGRAQGDLWNALIHGVADGELTGAGEDRLSAAELAEMLDSAGDVQGYLEAMVERVHDLLGEAEEKGALLNGLALLASVEVVSRTIRAESRQELAKLLIQWSQPGGTLRSRMPEILPVEQFLDAAEALIRQGEAVPEGVLRLAHLLALPPGQRTDPWSRRGVSLTEDHRGRARDLLGRLSAANAGTRPEHASEQPFAQLPAVIAMRSSDSGATFGEAMDERGLNQYLERLLLRLLRVSADEASAGPLLDRLALRYLEHLDLGRIREAYELLVELKRLQAGGLGGGGPAMQRIVGAEGLDALLEAAASWGKQHREVFQIARLVGPGLIPGLLERLKVEEGLSRRRRLMEMVVAIGSFAIPKVRELLDDPRWYVARNAMILLRRLDDPELVERACELLDHDSVRLAAEALRTLIHARDARWQEGIRQLLARDEPRALHEVLVLAARVRHPLVGRLLLGELERRKGARLNEPETLELIEALGAFEQEEIDRALLRLAGLSTWRFTFRLTRVWSALARSMASRSDQAAVEILSKVAAQRDPAAAIAAEILARARQRAAGDSEAEQGGRE